MIENLHKHYEGVIEDRIKDCFSCYVPRKGDTIDEAMAHLLNNFPEKDQLRIMFLRESEGVYKFGQKRVAIKIDRGKPIVRIGGGFLPVGQFIEEYTQKEVDKLQRKEHVYIRFHNKIHTQKIAANQAQESLEHRPIKKVQYKRTLNNSSSRKFRPTAQELTLPHIQVRQARTVPVSEGWNQKKMSI